MKTKQQKKNNKKLQAFKGICAIDHLKKNRMDDCIIIVENPIMDEERIVEYGRIYTCKHGYKKAIFLSSESNSRNDGYSYEWIMCSHDDISNAKAAIELMYQGDDVIYYGDSINGRFISSDIQERDEIGQIILGIMETDILKADWEIGEERQLCSGNVNNEVLSNGMSGAEHDGTWTDGFKTRILFRIKNSNNDRIRIELCAVAVYNNKQKSIIYINGKKVFDGIVTSGYLTLDGESKDGIIQLDFNWPEAHSPKSSDNELRKLGIMIKSIKLLKL